MSQQTSSAQSLIKAPRLKRWTTAFTLAAVLSAPPIAKAAAQESKPNIIVIMGDDIGWFNVGAYNQGMMYSTTPNAEGTLGAVRLDDWKYRFIDQPDGWIGGTVHVDWPILSNLRLDPFERMEFQKGNIGSMGYAMDFYIHEFWRFVFVQQKVGEYAQTFLDYPPMQKVASFNLDALKAQLEARMAAMKAKVE
jgi:arylsulfatase